MVGAVRRVLDFGEWRDEVCEIEDVFAELGVEGEEAEGCCITGGGGAGETGLTVTTHGAKSSLSSEPLKDRVGFVCEADGAARKWRGSTEGRERGVRHRRWICHRRSENGESKTVYV